MRKGVFSLLVGALSLMLGVNLAMAGGTVTGKVSCKGVRTPQDTVVYIEKVDANIPPSEKHATQDQQNLVYVPHVQAVVIGTSVDFPNSDTVRHNAFSAPGSATVFNLGTYDVGVVKTVLFDKLGESALLCNVHAEMNAFILTVQNPYFAVTDKTGAYTINDVPPGKYTLTSWHEKLKPVSQEIEVTDGATVTANLDLTKKK